MATFQSVDRGNIRASICVNGIRETKTFSTKKRAKSWAQERELELKKHSGLADDKLTLGDLFDKYSKEVTPEKEGSKWEYNRLRKFIRDYPTLCNTRLFKLKREDFEDWMTIRAKEVKPSTINRELNIMSHTLTVAKDLWRWMQHNPMEGLTRPNDPPARTRRITEEEIASICLVLGFNENVQPKLKREFVGAAFLFAIETAMRAGEIASLTRSSINLEKRTAQLLKTKNGDERIVPLSQRAVELLKLLPDPQDENAPLFQLNSGTLSSIFLTHKNKTSIEDLTFHDTRHEATTRLASKFHVLDLARITGHRNINELLTYYDKSAEQMAVEMAENPVKLNQNPSTEIPKSGALDIDYEALATQMYKHMQKMASQ